MKCGKGRLIYDGVRETLSGKAAFMEMALGFRETYKEIAETLARDEDLRGKLRCCITELESGTLMSMDLWEEDLEVLFDAVFRGKVKPALKDADPVMQVYGMAITGGAMKVDLDITGFVLYAIVTNEMCRKKLEEEITDRNIYYECWEASKYNNPEFESCTPAESIWDLRLLVGVLEVLRAEEERGPAYKLFMKIIYAGFGYLKRQIKAMDHISGRAVKTIFGKEVQEGQNMYPVMSRIMLLLVIADDMGIPIAWDYDMIVLLQFYMGARELAGCCPENEDSGEAVASNTDHEDFLKRFDEKYGSHNSLSDLAVSSSGEEAGAMLFDVMGLFQMNPRKFCGHPLTEQECRKLLKQSEKWTLKKYWNMQVIAQLCKYIHQLEQSYLSVSRDCRDLQKGKIEKEFHRIAQKEKQDQNRIARLNCEKKQMGETILRQEQQMIKMRKQIETQEEKLQEATQELSALRSYVYLMGEEQDSREGGEDGKSDVWKENTVQKKNDAWKENTMQKRNDAWKGNTMQKKNDVWKDKKVLVVGGHINWQNKLKEQFPGWQFVAAGQKNLDGETVRGKDIIICNTEILAHSSYYKLVAKKGRNQKLFYVHSNNIQKCILELEAQMR